MGLWILGTYALLLLGMGWSENRRASTGQHADDAFYVNNRASGTAHVALSIMASCVGGSATLGMTGLAWEVGTPAFWWLGSGAIGLIVLTLCLARKVRASGVRTMPELAGRYLGEGSRRVASVIIVIAWMAILAAQFSALAALIAPLTGLSHPIALWSGAGVIIAYSVLGGQAAVIRSDVLQFILLITGLGLACAWLLQAHPTSLATVPFEVVNTRFSPGRLSYYLVILGGSYVVCPMLFGRMLSARDTTSARRGGLWAVAGLALTAALIVVIGLACRGIVPDSTPPELVLTTAITLFPDWLRVVVLVALFSAVISSADSCLLTAATVCGNDLLRLRHIRPITVARTATIALGLGGLMLATSGKGILGLLLMANDIYVCGVVAPMFITMICTSGRTDAGGGTHHLCAAPMQHMARNTTRLVCFKNENALMMAAMVCGGGLGLVASLTDNPMWSYCGLTISALLALVGLALHGWGRPVQVDTIPER